MSKKILYLLITAATEGSPGPDIRHLWIPYPGEVEAAGKVRGKCHFEGGGLAFCFCVYYY